MSEKHPRPQVARRFLSPHQQALFVGRAIAAEINTARGSYDKRQILDYETPGSRAASCAICGKLFWYRGRPVVTCSPPCAVTFGRTTVLITNARARGEGRVYPQTYRIYNSTGRAPPRIALARIDRAMRRAAKRRKKLKRAHLEALIKTRTITATELAYLRNENVDVLIMAYHHMSSIFTREETERIRSRVARIVVRQLDRADAFLSGEKHANADVDWTNTHVSLFNRLLGKVLPDLSQTHNTHSTEAVAPESLTIEQLQAIVAGDTTINLAPTKVVTHDPEQRSLPNPLHSHPEGLGPGDPSPQPVLDPAPQPDGSAPPPNPDSRLPDSNSPL